MCICTVFVEFIKYQEFKHSYGTCYSGRYCMNIWNLWALFQICLDVNPGCAIDLQMNTRLTRGLTNTIEIFCNFTHIY
jgi:hypothetical protein